MTFRVKNDRRVFNPFKDTPFSAAQLEYVTANEAVVVDVILNDDHPQYAMDGYNVGAIKFRLLQDNIFRSNDSLNWAFPIDSNVTDYPLIHEIVEIESYLNRFYYTKKINVSSNVTAQPIYGINEELSPPLDTKNQQEDRRNSLGNPIKKTKFSLGNVFIDNNKTIKRLRSDEGDIIYEGRTGQSIRFGSSRMEDGIFKSTNSSQAPNLLFRVGPDPTNIPDIEFGLVQESINDDLSSIWMVSDQLVDLIPSTQENSVHYKSIINPPKSFDGNQVVINTDQFLVNTKNSSIFGFSGDGIHWETNADYTVDVGNDYRSFISEDKVITIGGDYLSLSGGKTSFRADKIYIGSSQNEEEPIPLGATLTKLLIALCDAHLNSIADHVNTAVGPGILAPTVVVALQLIKAQLQANTILSLDNFVSKKNEK